MRKKKLTSAIITILIILTAIFVLLYQNGIFTNILKSGDSSEIFAFKDTADVTKIFLADQYGNQVILSRTESGWMVNDSLPAMEDNIEDLLTAIVNIRVLNEVPKAARGSVNSVINYEGIKVEIYANRPVFKLLKWSFGEKEKLVKTYYMGPATQGNMSNFAFLVGAKSPHLVNMPGFRGFLTPKYSPIIKDWLSHKVFNTKITRIESLTVKDFMNSEESFSIIKEGTRFFSLYNAKNQIITNYDTTKLIDMLSEYREKNYEEIVSDLSESKIDSIFKFNAWKEITLKDVEGKTVTLTVFKKNYDKNREMSILLGDNNENIIKDWDVSRFYGIINGNKKNIYLFQYFHFDRQVQPLSYFLKK